jgi:predicted P-loop ATPase
MPKVTVKTSAAFRGAFHKLGYDIRLNQITGLSELNGQRISPHLQAKALCEMRELGFINANQVLNEVDFQALDNPFNPIREYFEGLSYDGKDYIQELGTYFQADQFFQIWMHRWLVAAIGKALDGKQCPMFIMDGHQGIGKSLFARWLCPTSLRSAFFTEGPIKNPDQKDVRLRATEKWIWEVSELGATTRRADVEALKAFITQAEVTERRPYGRQDEVRPAIACLIGTVNNGAAGVLYDTTGSRRFMVTNIQSINWKGYTQNIDVNNIWAQAYSEYLKGEPTDMTDQELALCLANNDNYAAPDTVSIVLDSLYAIDPAAGFVQATSVLEEIRAQGYLKNLNDNECFKQIASFFLDKGIQKKRVRLPNSGQAVGYYGIRRLP